MNSLNTNTIVIWFVGLILCGCTGAQVVADIATSSSSETDRPTIEQTLVIVGDDCLIAYSEDGGLSWSLSEQSGSCGAVLLEGIAYGNGVWVIVGSHERVLRSEDGKQWTEVLEDIVPDDTVHLESIAFDGQDLWVAVGSEGRLIYSEDNGETWASPSGSILYKLTIQSIATDGSGRWVAVSDGGNIAYSDTPKEIASWVWQQVTSLDFESVTFGNGSWIAVGEDGAIYLSDDGVSWVYESGNCSGNDFEDIKYNGSDQWMIIGDAGCIAISVTGLMGTWTEVILDGGEGGIGCSYVSSLQRWVFANSSGVVLYSDDSGDSWKGASNDSVLNGTVPLLIRSN